MSQPASYRHIFFDLDKTLTPSRALMQAEDIPLFERLTESYDVIVVTGGSEDQIRRQIPLAPEGRYYMLSQQGNHAVHKDGTTMWHETVTPDQEKAAKAFALRLTDEFIKAEGRTLKDPNDIFENRGSQLASSVVGFHESNEVKYAVDPDQSKRQALLKRHPEELERLREAGLEVMPAGTTTFDFILLGHHKGYNIERFLRLMRWKKDECIYVGDALFPGGNDESVIGVIPTFQVKDQDDTFAFVRGLMEA